MTISAFYTKRSIKQINVGHHDKDINPNMNNDEMSLGTKMGIDSHADTTCVNKHAFVESIVEGLYVDAVPFDDSIGKMANLPIVHAIYAYDDPESLQTFLLRFNNAIYIKNMKNALLCPNQAREYGVVVEDVPPHLDHTGSGSFSIMTSGHSFKLERNGPTACLHVRRPTNEELENIDIIDITDEHEWQPYQENLDRGICNVSIINTNIVHDEIDDWLLNSHNRRLCALQVTKPKDKLTPEYLAQLWKCGIDTARKTIDATTCKHYRNTVQGMTKRYRPTRNFMRYKQIRLPAGEFYTDTMIAKIRSIRGHTCAQIYGNKFGYIKAYPLNKHDKQNLGDSLSLIIQDVGVMQKLHTDNAPEMVGRKTPFFARARKEGIDLTTIEPLRPDENYGEILVKKAKITSSKIMVRRNVPLRLWCYSLEYACDLSSMMVPPMYRNNGRSGYEIVHGHTPDISEYVEFEFYEYCWYWDTPQSYPHEKKQF